MREQSTLKTHGAANTNDEPGVFVFGPFPEYQTAYAAGADIRAYLENPITIAPMQRALIPTGVYLALPAGYEAQVRPRSGLAWKHGITLINAVGTIDADYRGEILLPLVNLGLEPYTVEHGARVAQLVIARCARANFIAVSNVNELPAHEDARPRGTGGFGSTGA